MSGSSGPPAVGLLRVTSCWVVIWALQACSLSGEEPLAAASADSCQTLLNLPSPPGFPGELAALQTVHAVHGERSYHLEAVLQLSPDHVVVVLGLPLGLRLATIEWSGERVGVQRNADLPLLAAVPPEALLANIVLAFWPERLVRASLAEGVLLEVGPHGRRVLCHGRPVIEVERTGKDPWDGRTMVVDRRRGYSLAIVSQTLPTA